MEKSTPQLVTAVFIAFLTVSLWPAVDSEFNVTKCCPEGQIFYMEYKCFADTRNSLHEFRVPKSVNFSGTFDFYSSNKYVINYAMHITDVFENFLPTVDTQKYFNILETGYIETISGKFSPKMYDFCFEEIFYDEKFSYTAVVNT